MWNRIPFNRSPITRSTVKEDRKGRQKRKVRHRSSFQSLWQSTSTMETTKISAKRYQRRASSSILGMYSAKDPKPPYGLDPKIYPTDPRFINETFPVLPDTLYSPPYSTSFPRDRPGEFFGWGKGGKYVMHRSARRHRVWGSSTACQWVFSSVGQICRLTCPLNPPTPVNPAKARAS